MVKYVLVAIFSGILSAFSQVLLKKASMKDYAGIKQYLNPYVIGGYGITVLCMLLMVIAYKGMPFKYGSVIEALSYFYIMVLGKIFFNERLTIKRIAGNALIIVGVAVFSL